MKASTLLARAIVLGLSVAFGLVLVGCGASGIDSRSGGVDSGATTDPGGTIPAGMGALNFTVNWPQPEAEARLIPTGTQQVVVTVQESTASTPEATLVILRTDVVSGRVSKQLLVRSSDAKVVTVNALDGAGEVLSTATQTVVVREGERTHLAMALEPTGVTAPVVAAWATPDLVAQGESVGLSGTAVSTYGTIARYQWDRDGDGVFEYQSTTSPDTAITAPVGTHMATFRATDNDGLSTDAMVAYTVSAPTAPTWGEIPATVTATVGQPSAEISLPYTIGLPASPCSLTVSPATVTWTETAAAVSAFNGTLRATDPTFVGTIDVTLTLEDGLGRTAVATTQLVVGQGREWTWFVWVAGANNLEDNAFEDINEMEQCVYDNRVQVLAMVDTTASQGTHEGWEGHAFRYAIRTDSSVTHITSPSTDMGALDSGDWTELRDFIAWGVATYPANRYGLILWDHGDGFRGRGVRDRLTKGVCWDDDSGSYITTAQMAQVCTAFPGGRADIIACDACLMGMVEVAYEVKDVCDYFVGSEELEPGDGYEYNDMFTRIRNDALRGSSRVATDMVDSYGAYYGSVGYGDETLAAVDTAALDDVAAAASAFANIAISNWSGGTPSEWELTLDAVTKFGDPEFVDLYDLGSQAMGHFSLSALQSAATELRQATASAVEASWAGDYYPEAHGLAIWAPQSDSDTAMGVYDGLKWAADTSWDEFLQVAAP